METGSQGRKRGRNKSEHTSPTGSAPPPTKRNTRSKTRSESVPQRKQTKRPCNILDSTAVRNIVEDIIRIEEEEDEDTVEDNEEVFATPPAANMASNQDLASALTGITSRLDKIDEGLKANATKQDVIQVRTALTNLTSQLNKNTEDIGWLMSRRQEDAEKVRQTIGDCVQHEVQK